MKKKTIISNVAAFRDQLTQCYHTGCSLNIVFFLKFCDFSELCLFCCSASSTCLVCVHTLTPRERPESGIFLNLWKKHNI